ncbi:hypothetical protein F3K02_08925 [Hydrogenophaga sp. D2P1]|uniref:DUF1353 domain-containing protein n=1 Tax=Hydrogenophaga aromaticivorans TaxID=2610898 RepID=A0A7Y8GVV4_9BURK|nr:hypothetical protein [Hydrogenophaga aromaticivorans]NWF45368.1 hypothetical protein [Hydrogenophaga aromaticivorans]
MIQLVHYTEGYRYQTEADFEWPTGIKPVKQGGNRFVTLRDDGLLYIAAGYAWDGASGPAWNDTAFVRPSLVHDALCQLWALGIIDDAGRAAADKLLGKMLRQDMQIVAARMPWVTRKAFIALSYVRPLWVVRGVSWYSEHIANKDPGEVLTAP